MSFGYDKLSLLIISMNSSMDFVSLGLNIFSSATVVEVCPL